MPERQPWPEDRQNELEKLRNLLSEVSRINAGNYALERIARCIKMADELTYTDFGTPRSSFLSFLAKEANGYA